MNLRGKKVLVVGGGKSGIGSARLLGKAGALPVLFDSNEKTDIAGLRNRTEDIPELEIFAGTLPEKEADGFALVVISPGVPVDLPMLDKYRNLGIPVWGEIELASSFAKGRVVAITGTNGKTTTTTLVGQIMAACYQSVYVVGNIGNPYTDIAPDTTEDTVTVAEISSFQLETIEKFKPSVSAILNITPDHLNRHHTMECYVRTKEAITRNQGKEEICVLNYEDPYTRDFGSRCPAGVIWFSSGQELEKGIFLKGEEIFEAGLMAESGQGQHRLMNIHDMNLVGMCNVENVMAAIAIGIAMKVPMETILKTVREFKAVEHRIEFVAAKGGVDYYNDSKATNPDAAIQGIRAMIKPTVLLGGGYDKQSDYDPWIEAFDGRVKALVLTGQTREAIAACAQRHGIQNVILADTFEEAFQRCVAEADPGDAVLLSPACASWGMFENYEVRGRLFKELVEKIGV